MNNIMDSIQDYILDYIRNQFFKFTSTPRSIIKTVNYIIEFNLLTFLNIFLLKYNINILIYLIFCL